MTAKTIKDKCSLDLDSGWEDRDLLASRDGQAVPHPTEFVVVNRLKVRLTWSKKLLVIFSGRMRLVNFVD